MFRSSVAAFYRLVRRHFYLRACVHRDRFRLHLLRLHVRSKVKKIVYRMSEILFAAKIAFRRLHGGMPQQELNLLKLATAAVAQLRTGSPQVMRCNMLQARSLAAGLDYVPHDILRDAFPPYLSRPGDGSKDPSLPDVGCGRPLIERGFNPQWNGDGADMPSFANQVHDCPVALPHLHLIQLQAHEFRSPKATTEQHGQHCIVSLGTHAIAISTFEHL
jgi:hypothetical protein